MGVTKRLSLELPIYIHKMKGWQVGFCLTLMLGLTLGRPSLLGASQRFPFFLNQQQRQGHSLLSGHHGGHHEHHEHHHEEPLPESRALDTLYSAPPLEPLNGLYSAPAEEVVPLDGLYGAPPPPPPEPELPSYAEQPPPAPAPSAPEPVKAAAPMMMMDPSYNFEFSNEDSERSESNDINGVLKGSYSYKTPGVDANMDLENNYRFGYKVSDQEVKQEADAEGEVSGSYSYNMEDGREVEVRYTAGKDGFRVENLDELMATVREDTEGGDALGQYGAQAAADVAAVVVAKAAEIPASSDYDNYEPYVHEEIAAEPYVHQDMPYVHVDIPAEPYVHEEPVISAKVAPPPSTTSNKKSIGRRRVAVNKHQSSSAAVDRSFSFETKADDHEFTEKSDNGGERIGSYSYITPEGDQITVKYSAGKNGFVILNPEEVLPQPVV